MAERTIELETPVLTDETADALRAATDRAERAEAELAKLKAHPQASTAAAAAGTTAHQAAPAAHTRSSHPAETPAEEGNLFEGQEPSADAVAATETPAARTERDADRDAADDSPASHARSQSSAHAPGRAKNVANAADAEDDAVHAEALKQPPTPSSAANASGYDAATAVTERGSADRAAESSDGLDELRKDPMMAHLLDSLDAGTDVGHYGRLVFAMVARHFLPHAEVIAWMVKDNDFDAEQAQAMLHQVEGRDYNPPRRERLLQWQKEQEFQFMDIHDPDSGNLYRNLEFPKEVYDHIGHYQEAKASE